MKRNLKLLSTACAASLVAFSSLAQETPTPKPAGTQPVQERSTNTLRVVRLGRVEKATDLIGLEVRNDAGQKLGSVDDLAVDLETGRVVQVILSTGGTLGLFVMMVPVPPGVLHHLDGEKVIRLQSDKAKLKAAPWYGMSGWGDVGQSNQIVEVYRYHGQQPYFVPATQPAPALDPTARLGHVRRTTRLVGMPVKNGQRQTLGRVENLMVDLSEGRVVAVILSSGGLFGMGETLCAVPPAAFQFEAKQKHLPLDASPESLGQAPHFKASEWPNLGDPAYVAGIYRAYRIEPYFTVVSPLGENLSATRRP